MSGPVLRRRRAHPAGEDPPEDVEDPGRRRSLAPPGGRTDDEESDGDDGRRPLVVVGELASIAVGIAIIGISCVSLVVLLDHRDVIRLESARSLRAAVNRLLSDPATLASIEEALELKFLDREEHVLMKNELWGLTYQGKNLAAKAKEKEAAIAKIKELIDAGVPGEYERLASPLELGRYCDECRWRDRDRRTCKEHAELAAEADGTGRVAAKLRIMAEEAVLWERGEAGATCSFPPGCRWDCYLSNHAGLKKGFGDSERKALSHWIAWGFKEGLNCKCEGEHHGRREANIAAKASEREAAESTTEKLADAKAPEDKESTTQPELGRYCDDCEWKDGKTCKERADAATGADGEGSAASKLRVIEEEAALWEKGEPGATCSFPPGCRWDCYAENYPGLREALGSERKALSHWIAWGAFKERRNCECEGEHHGRREEEIAAKVSEMEAAESTTKELTDAKVPEEDKESASQPELGRYCDGCEWKDGKTCGERADGAAEADGASSVASKLKIMAEEAVLWEEKAPGATCSFPPGCRWDCYAENHADLKKAFGGSEQKALSHWIAWGASEEGRDCKCEGS